RVSEEGVEAHAGRQRDRQVGVQPHEDAREACDHHGGEQRPVRRHAAIAEHERVDDDDVGHRQEGRDAGDQLGASGRAQLPQLERGLQPLVHRPLPGGRAHSRPSLTDRSPERGRPLSLSPTRKKLTRSRARWLMVLMCPSGAGFLPRLHHASVGAGALARRVRTIGRYASTATVESAAVAMKATRYPATPSPAPITTPINHWTTMAPAIPKKLTPVRARPVRLSGKIARTSAARTTK